MISASRPHLRRSPMHGGSDDGTRCDHIPTRHRSSPRTGMSTWVSIWALQREPLFAADLRWQDPFARIERRTGRLRTDHHHGAPCRRPSILVAPWALDQDVARDVVRRGSSGPIRTTGCSRRRGGQWGYPPHLHLQVSLIEPETHDLPGVVTEKDRVEARRHFPDPRRYIGQVYDDGDQGGFRHRFR